MNVSVIGISHRTAPVEVREKFALGGEPAGKLLRAVHVEDVFDEAMVLDTCNRTEVYFVSRSDRDALAYILDHVERLTGTAPPAEADMFYRHDGPAAVGHLFRVAAALDSQIVGEHEVLGQVRQAYRQALEARTAGFLLNKLLHAALRTGKRTRNETQLGRGSASVAQAAVDLAGQVFSDLSDKTVLVVGAGQTAETAARRLIASGVGRVIVANRTLARARALAEALARGPDADGPAEAEAQCPALLRDPTHRPAGAEKAPPRPPKTEAIELPDVGGAIARADLVICSTGSPEPVLTMQSVGQAVRKRTRLLLIIDIAVPRDVESELGDLPDVFLYNMNDLDRVVARNIERRRQEIPLAEAIVGDEAERFIRWVDSRQTASTITLLQKRLDMLRLAEIKRYGDKFAPEDRDQLDPFTRGLCSKMLHQPIVFLKDLARRGTEGEQLAAVDTIRRMFDLDELEEDSQ